MYPLQNSRFIFTLKASDSTQEEILEMSLIPKSMGENIKLIAKLKVQYSKWKFLTVLPEKNSS